MAGTGVWLPGPVTAWSAVEAGDYDPEQHAADELIAVRVASDDVAPPDMAVHAAVAAVKRAESAGLDPEGVGLLLHTSIWFQGVEMWPAASYVAGHALGSSVPALGVRQECNAGVGALEIAAGQLAAGLAGEAAMVTTADRFGEPMIRRWSSEPGFVYGDGGTAVLLSRRSGFATLLSTATGVDNTLEAVMRGSGFRPVPTREPLDLNGRVAHYMKHHGGMRRASTRVAGIVRETVGTALADAGVALDEITRIVVPASGRSRMDWQAQQVLDIPLERSSWEFARQVGHLGAGDQFAGLNHLVEHRHLRAGDTVLLVGGGSGFSCTCAVLRIDDEPDWTPVGIGEVRQ
ncbi:ketoacyl-ACP synthase III family protein [Streptomyces sp. NPDC048172]|uniref:ketoacyl-ACP synthase III family protein n=1 Tax=Streptomyces sp. NPDC048172 TaxID=3365505 RepID=UPI00371D1E0B